MPRARGPVKSSMHSRRRLHACGAQQLRLVTMERRGSIEPLNESVPPDVVEGVPLDANAASTTEVVPVVVAQPIHCVPEPTPPSPVEPSLTRQLSTARPTLRKAYGIPICSCRCEGPSLNGCETPAAVFMGTMGYVLIAAIVVLSSGGVALLLAPTGLYGGWLGFVSWLLVFCPFVCCGVFCTKMAANSGGSGEEDAKLGCALLSCFMAVLASILCIVLAHIADKIHYLESAGPAVAGVDPRATVVPGGSPNYLKQDEVREISFARGAYIDIGLGTAFVSEASRDWCVAVPIFARSSVISLA